jgi:hypothetical protein
MTLYAQQDLSAYILTLLDDHLAAMQGIRERMRTGSTTSPGARRALALESGALAAGYAGSLNRALSHSRPFPDADRLV